MLPLSPAALARDAASDRARELKTGDYLLAVDGRDVTARTNLDELLSYKINRRVVLAVSSSADGAGRREGGVRCAPSSGDGEGAAYRKGFTTSSLTWRRCPRSGPPRRVPFRHVSASLAHLIYLDSETKRAKASSSTSAQLRRLRQRLRQRRALAPQYLRWTPRGFATAPSRTVLASALNSPPCSSQPTLSLRRRRRFSKATAARLEDRRRADLRWISHLNVPLIDGTSSAPVRQNHRQDAGMARNPRTVDFSRTRPSREHTEATSTRRGWARTPPHTASQGKSDDEVKKDNAAVMPKV